MAAIALSNEETLAAKTAIDGGKFYLRLQVEFGPDLADHRKMTRGELSSHLRNEAAKHTGFSSVLLGHIAEHMELDHAVRRSTEEPAPAVFRSGYAGCGSCNRSDGNMGQVCHWEDGTSSCELC